jgi:hypothetical protein
VPELAYFLIGKMNKSEQRTLTLWAFVEEYAVENKIVVNY